MYKRKCCGQFCEEFLNGTAIYLFSYTHNPKTIKLHLIIEVFDFLFPPCCGLSTEEVWECGERPVQLEMIKRTYIIKILIFTQLH